ncbi:uncharacterized protein METZ01_LOCUS508789, partial [marine metagenome]
SISLFMSCSFVTDSKDSDSIISPMVGTWNVTNIKYFSTLDCSGVPTENIDVNSLEQLAEYGLDEYQSKITITMDLFIILIHTISSDTSDVRVESVTTGIVLDHGDQFCVIWDTGDGDECDECRNYTINGDEVKIISKNCPLPIPPNPNGPCEIYTLVKQ